MKPMTPLQLAIWTLPKRRRLKKPIRQIFPKTIEHKFVKSLRSLVGKMCGAVREIIVPQLPGMGGAAPKRDAWRMDITEAEKLKDLLALVRQALDDDFSEEAITELISATGGEISSFNRMQVHNVFKSVLGVDLLSSEPNLSETIAAFVSENVSLIKSIQSQYLGEVEQVVLRGFRSGVRHEEIARQLIGESSESFVSRIGKAESRAELIARDQTGKLYGQLTELRQTAAGVEEYIRRTAGDERVRASHAILDGQRFSWDDPPSVGHPGEDIGCRCWAEPVIELG